MSLGPNATLLQAGCLERWLTYNTAFVRIAGSCLKTTLKVALIALIWLGIIIAGMGYLMRYESTPAKTALASTTWPINSALRMRRNGWSLLVAIHPQCPCSRATVEELARVVELSSNDLSVVALVFKPTDEPEGWERTKTWDSLARIPGISLRCDVEGREAQKFGAATSGQVFLYDGSGRLVFSGGITDRRGHSGRSLGGESILSILGRTEPFRRATPVFGCSLITPCEDSPN